MFGIDTVLNLFRSEPRRTANAKAVVTGAGSGIGRSFALELARRGGDVIWPRRNHQRGLGGRIRCRAVDGGLQRLEGRCDVVFTDGPITPSSMSLSQQLARWTGLSADNVAARTLDAHDAGQLYVVPQLDAAVIWHLKRHFPGLDVRGTGLLSRVLPKN